MKRDGPNLIISLTGERNEKKKESQYRNHEKKRQE